MKNCTKCKKEKSLSEFPLNKRMRSGRGSWCKRCSYLIDNDPSTFKTSPTAKLAALHAVRRISTRLSPSTARRTKAYLNVERRVTKEELEAFYLDNWESFIALHAAWVKSGFNMKMYPSLDRIDNKGHYELGNLQLLSLVENIKKSHRENPPRRGIKKSKNT